ncbi:hypothetical protein GCM10010102_43690 [Promicromonospora citrea]|uniref:Uncharacterized protein n=1 Tax=Promicromonospora citrea TaxID=43677 RepID=A0A8H9L8I5_9MICO|nr:hypothetical protein GCM10010102_43690 [Promicromonospora citrea]
MPRLVHVQQPYVLLVAGVLCIPQLVDKAAGPLGIRQRLLEVARRRAKVGKTMRKRLRPAAMQGVRDSDELCVLRHMGRGRQLPSSFLVSKPTMKSVELSAIFCGARTSSM